MNDKILKGMTINHRAKMEGMVSFSTSNLENKFCERMKELDRAICQKCFADRQLKIQPATRKKMARNEWIKKDRLKKKDVPFLNYSYFRFEAFGEIETEQQVENYMTIAKANKHCTFTLFTKRADILRRMTIKKPSNFLISLSSPLINEEISLDEKLIGLVNSVFTVYDKETIARDEVVINCGARKCVECLLCYKKGRTIKRINEELK